MGGFCECWFLSFFAGDRDLPRVEGLFGFFLEGTQDVMLI